MSTWQNLSPSTNLSVENVADPIAETGRLMEEIRAELEAGKAPVELLSRLAVVGAAACARNSRRWLSEARGVRAAREAALAEAEAAEKAAALVVALTGPPAAPADATEQALALHRVALEAYSIELRGQDGAFSQGLARRVGWNAAVARYRRHERPIVSHAQAEQRLRDLGLGGWAD